MFGWRGGGARPPSAPPPGYAPEHVVYNKFLVGRKLNSANKLDGVKCLDNTKTANNVQRKSHVIIWWHGEPLAISHAMEVRAEKTQLRDRQSNIG